MMRTLLAVLALTLSAGTLKADDEHGFWWYQEAKIACMGDVMRLCRSFVPDEDKVRGCMKDKKAQVSESCAEFYPGGAKAN
jgi:hypothetical protein